MMTNITTTTTTDDDDAMVDGGPTRTLQTGGGAAHTLGGGGAPSAANTLAAAARRIGGLAGRARPPPPSMTGPSNPPRDLLRCPVCCDTLSDPMVTACGHTFCARCVSALLAGGEGAGGAANATGGAPSSTTPTTTAHCAECGSAISRETVFPNHVLAGILRHAAASAPGPGEPRSALLEGVRAAVAAAGLAVGQQQEQPQQGRKRSAAELEEPRLEGGARAAATTAEAAAAAAPGPPAAPPPPPPQEQQPQNHHHPDDAAGALRDLDSAIALLSERRAVLAKGDGRASLELLRRFLLAARERRAQRAARLEAAAARAGRDLGGSAAGEAAADADEDLAAALGPERVARLERHLEHLERLYFDGGSEAGGKGNGNGNGSGHNSPSPPPLDAAAGASAPSSPPRQKDDSWSLAQLARDARDAARYLRADVRRLPCPPADDGENQQQKQGRSASPAAAGNNANAANNALVSALEVSRGGRLLAAGGARRRVWVAHLNTLLECGKEKADEARERAEEEGGERRSRAVRRGGEGAADDDDDADDASPSPWAAALPHGAPGGGTASSLAFSPAEPGWLLAAGCEGAVSLWDASAMGGGGGGGRGGGNPPPSSSANGGDPPGMVRQWHCAHPARIWDAHFCPTQPRVFVTAGDDGTVRLWDIRMPNFATSGGGGGGAGGGGGGGGATTAHVDRPGYISTPCVPALQLDARAHACSVRFAPRDPHTLAVGTAAHVASVYDLRLGGKPVTATLLGGGGGSALGGGGASAAAGTGPAAAASAAAPPLSTATPSRRRRWTAEALLAPDGEEAATGPGTPAAAAGAAAAAGVSARAKALKGHRRAVAYVRWLRGKGGDGDQDALVTASTDSTLRVWAPAKAGRPRDGGKEQQPEQGAAPPAAGAAATGADPSTTWRCRSVHASHLNNRHFVGLAVRGGSGSGSAGKAGLLATGTEDHSVVLYRAGLPAPLLSIPLGGGGGASAPGPTAVVGSMAAPKSHAFVSALAWPRPRELLAADSRGQIVALALVE